MRITKISIKDFRAFRGAPTVIDLTVEGHNLLVYGENGSGKSSLFQALNLFFSPLINAPKFEDNKNIYVTTNDGHIKLDIGDDTSSPTYEWEEAAIPFKEKIVSDASKTKGFLDYRSLLETHFIQRYSKDVDIFSLTVNTLLANFLNPIKKIPFKTQFANIKSLVAKRRSKYRDIELKDNLDSFNAGLISTLNELSKKSNEILALFEHSTSISFLVPGKGIYEHAYYKQLENQAIYLKVSYNGKEITGHHHFLNESRLSAVAISIYLAALLLTPPSQLRVIFLDDVLIGFDMSNRLPLLNILSTHFSDWQIFLTTYDRVWFEMVRFRVKDWNSKWAYAEFYCGKSDEGDIPIYVKEWRDYLGIAREHLDANDLKAAAIYIRSAYEDCLKHFADKQNLHIRYCVNPKDQKADYFWLVVSKAQLKTGGSVLDAALIAEVELYRSAILNQLSHTAPVTFVRREVEDSLNTINKLQAKLDTVPKSAVAN
ncbi:MAG: hypothetical protein A2Y12_11775 [Planctomycetes bacterium GWF2_42_9]|nr:MAG: hypothetical protein A2Y12_11775 [Planctomycetes bacterium GWF2_42_9]